MIFVVLYIIAGVFSIYKTPSQHRLFIAGMMFGILLIFFPYDILNGFCLWGATIDTKSYNNLGDFIGGITATYFSGFAVYLLYLTYNSQRDELAMTRRIMNKQQFETTLFNMINIHIGNVKSIQTEHQDSGFNNVIMVEGRQAFGTFFLAFGSSYGHVKKDEVNGDQRALIRKAYNNFYKRAQPNLGHYFRTLYHIVKFIDASTVVTEADKKTYIGTVRAQLSSQELLMLFYNCLSKYGAKFKPLIEKHELLQNIPQKKLFSPEHKELYDPKAFGSAYRNADDDD